LSFLSVCAFKWREFKPGGEELLRYHLPLGPLYQWFLRQKEKLPGGFPGGDPGAPLVVEPYRCCGGCSGGGGLGKWAKTSPGSPDFLTPDSPGAPAAIEEVRRLFSRFDSELRLEDFCYPGAAKVF
jgi:hypothetical protein